MGIHVWDVDTVYNWHPIQDIGIKWQPLSNSKTLTSALLNVIIFFSLICVRIMNNRETLTLDWNHQHEEFSSVSQS